MDGSVFATIYLQQSPTKTSKFSNGFISLQLANRVGCSCEGEQNLFETGGAGVVAVAAGG